MKTLIAKELRENFKWLIVGLAIMLTLTWMGVPKDLNSPQSALQGYLGTAAALFALFLGFMQSVFDYSDRQQGFLVHRAVCTKDILASKIASGLMIYLVVVCVPLIAAACYFAEMGPSYLPVRPLQIVAPLLLVLLCYSLHPAAILVVRRPAKWYGTKLLPVMLPCLMCYVYYFCGDNSWPSWGLLIFFSVLLLIHTVGFMNLAFKKVYSTLMALIIVSGVAVFMMGTIDGYMRSWVNRSSSGTVFNEYGIDKEGTMWHVRVRRTSDQYGKEIKTYVSGSPISPDLIANLDGPVPKDLSLTRAGYWQSLNPSPKAYGSVSELGYHFRHKTFWDERGYMLEYEHGRMKGSISRDGFSPGERLEGTPFAQNPANVLSILHYVGSDIARGNPSLMNTSMFIGDSQGLYVFDSLSNKFRVVLDQPISAIATVYHERPVEDEFMIETADSLIRFRVEFKSTEPNSLKSDDENFEVKQIASYPRLPHIAKGHWVLGIADGAKITGLSVDMGEAKQLATLDLNSPVQWSVQNLIAKQTPAIDSWNVIISSLFPLAILVIAAIFAGIAKGVSPLAGIDYLPMYPMYMSFALLVSLCAFGLTAFLIRSRLTDRRSITTWLLLCIPFGLATPLAIALIYPVLTFDRCSRCDRKRRVDRSKCEHCGSGWEQLPTQGIELLELQPFPSISAAT